jgi:N-dimethylarginine dimethylaminohydrolase
MKSTCHSEYGKLKSIFIKQAADAFVNDAHIDQYWKELNFLSKPEFNQALSEYSEFEKLIARSADQVFHLPQDNSVTMDSIYCRDAAIATDYGMILCNMGKAARKPEPAAEKRAFENHHIKILGTITAPGTLEGGDVAWINEKTLAVGHTYRTNEEGIQQLKQLLEPHGVDVLIAEMPHYKGPSDVFHLMSVFSPVDKDLAVVYSPLMPISLRNRLIKDGYNLVEVPDAEWDSMGCNVLAIAPRECVMVKGNSITKKLLEQAGCKVHEYEGQEISVKGGGGPTCLTRPIERFV